MNHAHLFNLMLNSCVQLGEEHKNISRMYFVSITDYCFCSGPTDIPMHASILYQVYS